MRGREVIETQNSEEHSVAPLRQLHLRNVPYETALQRLQLFSPIRRRIRGELSCMYEIVHGLLNFSCDVIFAATLTVGFQGLLY